MGIFMLINGPYFEDTASPARSTFPFLSFPRPPTWPLLKKNNIGRFKKYIPLANVSVTILQYVYYEFF